MNRKKMTWFDILNVFLLLGVVFVTLYPFLYMFNVSLSGTSYVMKNQVQFWPKGFNIDMYKIVLSDNRILMGYKNTIVYVVVGTIISLILTSMGAYAISRRMVMRKALTLYIVFTMLFQGGMIPTFLVVRELGIMNTMWAMVLPGAISVWNLIIMRTFFQGIPSEMIESGKMDGLNDIGVFARLVIPLSKPLLATIGLFYAVAMWNNFFLALLYLSSENLYPLQVVLRNLVLAGQFTGTDINSSTGADGESVVQDSLKFATIIVSTLPILMVYPFIQKYFVKGVMIGSVKG